MALNLNLPPIYEGNGPISLENWAKRRKELVDILRENVYGFSPEAPKSVRAETVSEESCLANKAFHRSVKISFDTPKEVFTFTLELTVPKYIEKPAVFLLLNFRPEIPDKYYPQEEIIDRGYACARLFYKEISCDNPDMTHRLAGRYDADKRPDNGWGKLSMWSFAASRAMDYLVTLDEIDKEKVIVIGHSRMGKTALWTAAQDERFAMAISNDSGCSGAGLSRMNILDDKAEHIEFISDHFHYWFCENYAKYANKENEMPFDQHFLVAAIAPRPVAIGSAVEDLWACPESEFEAAREAGKIYERLGFDGLVYPKDAPMPLPGTALNDGNVAYHIRNGSHFLSRTDWNAYMDFADKKFKG